MEFTQLEIFFMFVWFIAAFVNGVTGLGGAMVAVPMLAFFIGPHTLIPVSGILALLMSIEMAFIYRKDIDYSILAWMCLGGLPGLLLGTFILLLIPASVLQIFIGTVMILFSFWQLKNKADHLPSPATRSKSAFSGFMAGTLCTSISFAGPPVAIYTLHYGANQHQAFSIIGAITTFLYSLGFVFQASVGFFDDSVLRWLAIGLVPTTLGILGAVPVAKRVKTSLFRLILVFIIMLGGFSCLYNGFFR